MLRTWFVVIVGLGGLAILLALAQWQLQRLAWKEALLANISQQIAAPAVALPEAPDATSHRYLPVQVRGRFDTDAPQLRMLASRRHIGAVHRHLAVFDVTDGPRILVDLGWRRADAPAPDLPTGTMTLTGNLDWPLETDGFTPEPDMNSHTWYARDVPPLAAAYDTAPLMLVLREMPQTSLDVTPWPVDTDGIPNDHMQYAITWFSLAAIWAGMTLLVVLRGRRRLREES